MCYSAISSKCLLLQFFIISLTQVIGHPIPVQVSLGEMSAEILQSCCICTLDFCREDLVLRNPTDFCMDLITPGTKSARDQDFIKQLGESGRYTSKLPRKVDMEHH